MARVGLVPVAGRKSVPPKRIHQRHNPLTLGLTFFAMTSNAVNSLRFRPKTAFGKKIIKVAPDRRRGRNWPPASTVGPTSKTYGTRG